MKAVFDTNILVDYLNGLPQAAEELNRYNQRLISQITWMEVMAGCRDDQEEQLVRGFLATFDVVPIDAQVAETAVILRRTNRLRLPDAIILATAECSHALLVTRDTKDFPSDTPGIRVPYRL
ncbi:PilT protein domain protein [Thioalkalivibrio sulfidiphilus HL-EbGr7]|uniref:Ribonuclease VapC n=1 Tax=Thioalkalivibrio sulfidiphilus (strain HL-EbGR7) TaxID=396588 RepID=B8GTR8_THISH|nr:type II toxin-antitoxin system VapC family toxin [Thioalkalivibrio sulfidiphilus]ACL73162.1 PilT protein domain protein [Thioalkalivibrio sulfidiphilus HL-EbGr7]